MLTVKFKRLGLRPGERLLDLGCGAGRHAFEGLRQGARVTAFDLDPIELKEAARTMDGMVAEGLLYEMAQGSCARGDALRLPFPDGSFDRVIAAEVLEHIPADREAMIELARVVRPGGTIAVTVPRWFPERICWALSDEYHGVEGGHVRIYRAGELSDRMTQAGLMRVGSHHAHGLHAPYWWLRCAVGVNREQHRAVRIYHRFLVWDLVKQPLLTRFLERVMAPILGKSLVIYFTKPAFIEPAEESSNDPELTPALAPKRKSDDVAA